MVALTTWVLASPSSAHDASPPPDRDLKERFGMIARDPAAVIDLSFVSKSLQHVLTAALSVPGGVEVLATSLPAAVWRKGETALQPRVPPARPLRLALPAPHDAPRSLRSGCWGVLITRCHTAFAGEDIPSLWPQGQKQLGDIDSAHSSRSKPRPQPSPARAPPF